MITWKEQMERVSVKLAKAKMDVVEAQKILSEVQKEFDFVYEKVASGKVYDERSDEEKYSGAMLKILTFLNENNGLSFKADDIADRFDLALGTVGNYLYALQKDGKIKRLENAEWQTLFGL